MLCHVIFVLSISVEVLLCAMPCDFWSIHINRGPATGMPCDFCSIHISKGPAMCYAM